MRLLQLCTDRFPHSMATPKPDTIVTVNAGTPMEIQELAPATVGDALEEPNSGSQTQNLNRTTDKQEDQAGALKMNRAEKRIRKLAEARGLELTPLHLWTVAYQESSEAATRFENVFYKREEAIRSVKNEIYQVVGFFSAFQGLLITAAAQSNLLRCNNVGFILTLSALATVVAVLGILQKITAMEELRLNKNGIQNFVEAYHSWQDELLKSGIDKFDFFQEPADDPTPLWKAILLGWGIWLPVSVVAFGALCAVAMRQIVCNPGHSLPSN